MRILVIYSNNYYENVVPFISEQVDSLRKLGHELEYFPINRRGLNGYLLTLKELNKHLKSSHFDLVHAHFGLAGAMATLQRQVPVVTTYHGSDINLWQVRLFSFIAITLSKANIFVSERIKLNLFSKKAQVIPCGVDLDVFYKISKQQAREQLGLDKDEKLVLFSSFFENDVKNSKLAFEAMELVPNARILELKGYNRNQVNLMLNACDCLLMTSFSEGSPQIIKEALVTNCPVVSTHVGDVSDLIHGISKSYITGYDAVEIADRINSILATCERTNGEQKKEYYSLNLIAGKIDQVYKNVVQQK